MKRYVFQIFIATFCAVASATDMSIVDAWKHGAEVEVLLKVVDEQGKPISGAKVTGGFKNTAYTSEKFSGIADENGEYLIKGSCKYDIGLFVRKDGYYGRGIMMGYSNSAIHPAVVDGKWQPYGEKKTIILIKRTAPVKLIRKPWEAEYKDIPVFGEWIGYDLERWDFCHPYGSGIESDVLLRFYFDRQGHDSFTKSLEVSFTNNVHAGFYAKKKDKEVEIEHDLFADTNAPFATAIKYNSKMVEGRILENTRLGEDEYLVFRTRTKVDDKNNLVECHYGIIFGDWKFGEKKTHFGIGYFNPNCNDNNLQDVEFQKTLDKRHRRLETTKDIKGDGKQ